MQNGMVEFPTGLNCENDIDGSIVMTNRLKCSRWLFSFGVLAFLLLPQGLSTFGTAAQDDISPEELKLVKEAEQARIQAIEKVRGAVVAIYSEIRGGGGSGVIFHPSGLVLTNHHVVAGAGVSGWAGIADGNLYRWKLVGTDPGGDVAIIRLLGNKPFPYASLGDSNRVKVGDWALAMGNPFVLTEDQKPTVTLGIVSGIERYQPGAGGNQLVYGNCIQVDSSINPGNSGGPLFNMQGEVIGINGRGSFMARGRVNVGLGYAISANQIKNFIADLMATKLVEHGTLDVRFGDRNGKVVCEAMYNEGVEIVDRGLELGDELVEFEGIPIRSNDQFTNLVSMLPETWPANVVFRKSDGTLKDVHVRLVGLPYKIRPPRRPAAPPGKGKDKGKKKEPTPEQKRAMERAKQMAQVMTTPAGTIRDEALNRENCDIVLQDMKDAIRTASGLKDRLLLINDTVFDAQDVRQGTQSIWIANDGRFRIVMDLDGLQTAFVFDGQKFWRTTGDGDWESISNLKARLTAEVIQVIALAELFTESPYSRYGKVLLDGSDKSQGRPAFRLKTIDESDDWFFVWANAAFETNNRAIRLSKVSPDLNADGKTGAVLFKQWQDYQGIQVPVRREFVSGLEEKLSRYAIAEKVDLVDQDPALFTVKNEKEEQK